mgnify:CR=1 FL=1
MICKAIDELTCLYFCAYSFAMTQVQSGSHLVTLSGTPLARSLSLLLGFLLHPVVHSRHVFILKKKALAGVMHRAVWRRGSNDPLVD